MLAGDGDCGATVGRVVELAGFMPAEPSKARDARRPWPRYVIVEPGRRCQLQVTDGGSRHFALLVHGVNGSVGKVGEELVGVSAK